jgi:hypothetical protein
MGFNFLAKTFRSADVSMLMEAELDDVRAVTAAPLKADGVKAAALPARRDAKRSFMVERTFKLFNLLG